MTEFATTAHGDRVAYDRRGEGPGLVFIAGGGPIFRANDPVTSATAELASAAGLCTVVYDRLGRGESRAGGRLTLERELGAVAAMLEVVGGRAVLCGHSSGCSIALAAADAGLPVASLALWEAPLGDPSEKVRRWFAEFERRLDAEDYVGATEQYMEDMPPEWLEGLRQSPDFAEIARGAVSQRADGESLVWATHALEDGSLAGLHTPLLAMYGTSTLPEMPSAAAWIASVVTGTSVEEMPGTDHTWEAEPMARRLAELALTHP
ncbi:alpha/beta hydrolase [Actinotalea sp. BY-33]|uniref:Alpha/beta hydrolase n=1 Tax=Actinotalea soli TaxID=2819234 RepID=A0A939LQB4_9CELL|nr:alpha/beta hydrolase [Actinotalea soli]MBO1752038.1 alpha/beta hydrolase [Actinotalea soli]